MLLLLTVPVLALVTAAHHYLQLYAPSNALIARALMPPRQWRGVLLLTIVASATLVAMHFLAEAVAGGAPGWLNLFVLVLAWDALKFAASVPASLLMLARARMTERRRWRAASFDSMEPGRRMCPCSARS